MSTYTVLGFAGYGLASLVAATLFVAWDMPLTDRLIAVLVPPLAFLTVVKTTQMVTGIERIVFYRTAVAGVVGAAAVAAVIGAGTARIVDVATIGIGSSWCSAGLAASRWRAATAGRAGSASSTALTTSGSGSGRAGPGAGCGRSSSWRRLQIAAPANVPAYQVARQHIDDLVHLIELRAARAIAEAWNTGQLSSPAEDQRPFEREVLAILGRSGGYATDLLADAEQRLAEYAQGVASRAAATVAAGTPLPYIDIAREMGLSRTATQILLVVIAPLIRGEIARLYGVLANDEHRPLVDRFLVEVLIAGRDARIRAEIAAELAPDAPLIRYGLVRTTGDSPLFAELSADLVLVDRIRGREAGDMPGVSVVRGATRPLSELHLPDEIKRELVLALALAEARPAEAPLRLILRGRRGAGRHSAKPRSIPPHEVELGFDDASYLADR